MILFDSLCSCSTLFVPVQLSLFLFLFDSLCSCSTPVWQFFTLFDFPQITCFLSPHGTSTNQNSFSYFLITAFHGGAKHSTDVTLFANIALASVKKTKETNLHVHLESTANNSSTVAAFGKQQLVQASSCKLHIHNVKTNKEITMKRISCTESRTYIIALTSFVNKWLKSTSTTLAVRVRISSNSSNVPTAMLPFINSSSHVEQPYYILYV